MFGIAGATRLRSARAALAAVTVLAVLAWSPAQVAAQDIVRHGIQIGALGALRTTLPEVGKKYGITYEIKDFGDSTAALRALDQGALEVANTTAQHLARAISENMAVVWVAGWGGGYNVLVAGKGFDAGGGDAALKAAILKRKAEGKPVKIGVPTGSMQHAKLLQYLTSIGVDGDKDVQVVNVPFPVHPRALDAGEVDMAMTLAGFGALAMEKSGAKMVKHIYAGPYGKQEIGFIVQKSLIEKNPGLVQRIVASHVEAMNKFIGNMDAQVAYERKYSRFPPSVVDAAERKFLHYDYRTNVADLKSMAKELHALGWMKDDLSSRVDAMIDLSFLAKATGKSVADLGKW